WSARGQIYLPDRADVVGKMNYTAGDAIELRLADLARLLQRLEPAVRFRCELVAQLLPLSSGDARPSPTVAPVRIVERILAAGPAIHQRQPVTEMVDVRGDRRSCRC